MSLDAMLHTHDDAALTALASVGLVRRASRDQAAGKAEVLDRDANQAQIRAGGQTVQIDAGGPAKARCDCPATGVCRHIVLAVLELRTGSDAPAVEASTSLTAAQELDALEEADLRKFAGADWDKAVAHARLSEDKLPVEQGPNLSVSLADSEHTVTFIAGQSLVDAVYKGPKSNKRHMIAAAAMRARAARGVQESATLTFNEPTPDTLAPEFLAEVRARLEDVVTGVFSGGSALAEDQLFDLSISARTQAAPRLTALLRLVRRQAIQAREAHIAYRDDQFLTNAATTYALTHALEAAPQDPDLAGQIRRDYAEIAPVNLLPLGAVKWHAEGGARGLRLHLYDLDGARWLAVGQARAAGMDPSFHPDTPYNAPLWGAGATKSTVGTLLRLKDGRLASDGALAWDHGKANQTQPPDLADLLLQHEVLHTRWDALMRDVAARRPSGLRDKGHAIPVLLRPQNVGEMRFDDIAQTYELAVSDIEGRVLPLTLPAAKWQSLQWLGQNAKQIDVVLCEMQGQTIAPVTVFKRGGVSPHNLTLDPLPKTASTGQNTFTRAKRYFGGARELNVEENALLSFSDTCFDVIATIARRGQAPTQPEVIQVAQDYGFVTLSDALKQLDAHPSFRQILAASYLCAEIARRSAVHCPPWK